MAAGSMCPRVSCHCVSVMHCFSFANEACADAACLPLPRGYDLVLKMVIHDTSTVAEGLGLRSDGFAEPPLHANYAVGHLLCLTGRGVIDGTSPGEAQEMAERIVGMERWLGEAIAAEAKALRDIGGVMDDRLKHEMIAAGEWQHAASAHRSSTSH